MSDTPRRQHVRRRWLRRIPGGGARVLAVVFALDLAMPLWAAFSSVAALFAFVCFILFRQARTRMSEFTLGPEQTIETIKEDIEWAKRAASESRHRAYEGGPRAGPRRDRGQDQSTSGGPTPDRSVRGTLTDMKERVMGSAESATSTVTSEGSSVAGSVRDAASDVASSVGDAASGAADAVRGAPDVVKKQTEGNPMAVGLIAFGLGALGHDPAEHANREEDGPPAARAGRGAREGNGERGRP